VGCENREDETVCELGSVTAAALLLVLLQSFVLTGWVVARTRRSRWAFSVTASSAIVVSVIVAGGALLWASGDI
jgi:hypothetical protein